jgi:hypothetical protein
MGTLIMYSLKIYIIDIETKKWSGREDLNLRPPAPKAGALNQTALRPDIFSLFCNKQQLRSRTKK